MNSLLRSKRDSSKGREGPKAVGEGQGVPRSLTLFQRSRGGSTGFQRVERASAMSHRSRVTVRSRGEAAGGAPVIMPSGPTPDWDVARAGWGLGALHDT